MSSSRFTWDVRSDVGQVREINQDSVHASDGVFVVADGMGGHRGGEVASAVAIEPFSHGTDGPHTIDGLVQWVRDAHEAILERAETDSDLLGMGTTLCAVVRLDDHDDAATLGLVNVGDSRIYMFVEGELDQLSEDHSLVGDMVRHGRLTREEASTHPQRNIVTRALGIGEDLLVDYWELPARVGDRYLLCSDGLVDEVADSEIAAVLRRLDDPSEAVDELVRLAHASGSRDNVSVLVVRVDEGAPGDGQIVVAPSVSAPDTPTLGTLLPDVATPTGTDVSDAIDPTAPSRGFRLHVTRKGAASILAVLLILLGGIWLVGSYARNNYFVGFDQDQVVIYQGRPGGILWFDPTIEDQTEFLVVDLTPALASEVDGNPEFGSVSDAQVYVDELESRAIEANDQADG